MLCNYSDFDDVHSAGEGHNSEMDDSDRCNLIVNYLPHEIDDGILKVIFKMILMGIFCYCCFRFYLVNMVISLWPK